MSRAQRVVAFVGIWTVLGLFFASRSILIYSYSQDEVDWILPLKLSLAEWYGWGLLAPAVLWLSRRFSLGPKVWRRNLPIHIAAGLMISMAKIVLDGFVQPLVGGYPSTLAYKLHTNLVTFWAIIAVSQAILYYRKYRDGELEATQLEAKLAQAQLNVLKSELQITHARGALAGENAADIVGGRFHVICEECIVLVAGVGGCRAH